METLHAGARKPLVQTDQNLHLADNYFLFL
jgi:hypothetical protein